MPQLFADADIRSFRPTDKAIQESQVAMRANIQPPKLVVASGEIFNFANDLNGLPLAGLFIQNCSTDPLKYCINDTATADVFHGIAAGCQTQDDGLGSVIDLSKYAPNVKVTVYSAGAVRCAVTIITHADKAGSE